MSGDAKRLLIVDDDDGIRHSLARIMRCKGFEVHTACDGETAVELAAAVKPRLIILDIRMPGIDGVEAYQRIRARYPQVPAIFMTAYASSSRVTDAMLLGAISVLTKPLELQSLVDLVDQTLRNLPVLIVDDDSDFLDRAAQQLRERGIRVSTAHHISEAIESLRREPGQVVLVIGGGNSPTWEAEHHFCDSIRYVAKPIDIDDLIRHIDQLTRSNLTGECDPDE